MGNKLSSCCWLCEGDQTPPREMGDSSSNNSSSSDNGLHHGAEGGGDTMSPCERDFAEKYEMDRYIHLGEGSTSFVTKCRHRVTRKTFAVKVIDKTAVLNEFEDRHVSDVEMMSALDHHPNIIGFEEAFETTTQTMVVMELFNGEELSSYVKDEIYLDEEVARDVIQQIASALAYMHWMGIVHRDIKPENVLVDTTSGEVKVIDLGEADWVVAGGMSLKRFWATEAYIAPEILLGGRFTFKADIWALGITAYYLMTGTLPSFGNDPSRAKYMNSETAGEKLTVCFDPVDEGNLSEAARDFLEKLLAIDPQARYSAFQVLEHPWLVGEELESVDVNEED